jgi:hypothetical protein
LAASSLQCVAQLARGLAQLLEAGGKQSAHHFHAHMDRDTDAVVNRLFVLFEGQSQTQ